MAFSTAHFRTSVTDSLGDTVIAYTLTAARWGVLAWDWYSDTFFSAQATRRYQEVGKVLGHLAILAIIGYRMAQLWADGIVWSSIHPNALPLTEEEQAILEDELEAIYAATSAPTSSELPPSATCGG